MAKIPFPDLPDFPGISGIPINPGSILPSAADINVTNIIAAIRSGSILSAYETLFGLKYGIYKDGIPLLEVDTITEIAVTNQSQISDFPTEQGAFRSYNKIALPSTYTLEMLKTNSLVGARKTDVQNTLQEMLRPAKWGYVNNIAQAPSIDAGISAIADILGVPAVSGNTIEYVDVVTPSKTYTNVQLESYSVTETNEDGNKLMIQTVLKEILQPISDTADNSTTASGAMLKNMGTVVAQLIDSASSFIKGKAQEAVSNIRSQT